MQEGKHFEIERKYLIRYPDAGQLRAQPGCEVWEIEQVYLSSPEKGLTRRIRRVIENGESRYYKTFKRRQSDLSSEEEEGEISEAAYRALLLERDEKRMPVYKTRYRIPYQAQTLEFDVYPFWSDRAILEIELPSEETPALVPEWVEIVRDVSGEKAYKNRQLAKEIPMEVL